MSLVPDRPYGLSLRLPGYDYSQPGYYYVTICTYERQCLFGDVVGTAVRLNEAGHIVSSTWNDLPRRFPGTGLDEYIIMPNHMHGIVVLNGKAGIMKSAPDLGQIIRVFKAVSSRFIRRSYSSTFAWQDDFYDHIIRGPKDPDRIRQYIVDNPVRWSTKHEENHPE